MSNENEEGVCN